MLYTLRLKVNVQILPLNAKVKERLLINTKCLSLGLDISLRTFLINNQNPYCSGTTIVAIFTTSQAKLIYHILIILLTPLNLLGYYTSAHVQGDMKKKRWCI